MIKDILGEILDAKKGKATIVINVGEMEDEKKEGENDELEKQGLAPVLKDEESDKADMADEMAIMNGEEREIMQKKKSGMKPKNLSERAKMEIVD